MVLRGHLRQQGLEGALPGGGARRQARQVAAVAEPRRQFSARQRSQQHPAGGGGVRRQPSAQVHAVGQQAVDGRVAAGAGDDHHLVAVQHGGREHVRRVGRQPVQRGLHHARQPRRCQVGARQPQHPRGQPEVAAVGFQVAQVREREQVPARRRAREPGALRRQRGVEPLALGVKTLEHGQALGQPGDVVLLRDACHAAVPFPSRGRRPGPIAR